ncbi:MAG: dihydroorotate dehydrogenase electron transfer subunit [Elusimicrobiota bacterium]|jgi:dihydroorotate dehydrogenase electron transfer subunit|nr:dihydroorotate dehydrogenase electron transfer subunit [Elusimicrobiota bacterium]
MKIQDADYKIVSNKEISGGYFELKIKAPSICRFCKPGQFFMLSVPYVFLRRPISIHNIEGDIISFLYKVVGKGTEILSKIKTGEIQALGALGNGYDLNTDSVSPAIIAGGTGIASLYFLAKKLKRKGILYYGAKSKKDFICVDKFHKLGWDIFTATEDGSSGYKGFVTDLYMQKTNLHSKDESFAYVCGPLPMLKSFINIAKTKNIKAYASLEQKMACAIGNCQACAVNINGINKMVCKDGPVFDIKEINL